MITFCTLIVLGSIWINPCKVDYVASYRKNTCTVIASGGYHKIQDATCEWVVSRINEAIQDEQDEYVYREMRIRGTYND